jgi:hypothetical protein
MPEYGPFATEADAWATEACAAERAAWAAPGDGEKFNMRPADGRGAVTGRPLRDEQRAVTLALAFPGLLRATL